MKHAIAALLVLSAGLPARAGDLPPPPPPPEEDSAPRAEEYGYFDSCFGVPHPGRGRFGIGAEMPIPLTGHSSSGTGPSISMPSSGDDNVKLVVVVLATMALPIVVYAVDEPAPRLVLQRFACPTFAMDLYGGAIRNDGGSTGFFTTRLTVGVGHFASDFQYDGASRSVSGFSTHLLLRPTPRAHVDGGLAIGYRRSVLGDRVQDGLEVGLPHRYALWRDGLATLGLEVRPMLLLGSSVEASLEGALLIPLAQVVQLRAGGRVYTFDGNLQWGLSAGLSLTL